MIFTHSLTLTHLLLHYMCADGCSTGADGSPGAHAEDDGPHGKAREARAGCVI